VPRAGLQAAGEVGGGAEGDGGRVAGRLAGERDLAASRRLHHRSLDRKDAVVAFAGAPAGAADGQVAVRALYPRPVATEQDPIVPVRALAAGALEADVALARCLDHCPRRDVDAAVVAAGVRSVAGDGQVAVHAPHLRLAEDDAGREARAIAAVAQEGD